MINSPDTAMLAYRRPIMSFPPDPKGDAAREQEQTHSTTDDISVGFNETKADDLLTVGIIAAILAASYHKEIRGIISELLTGKRS